MSLKKVEAKIRKADAQIAPELLAVLIDVAMNLIKGCLAKNKTPDEIAATQPLLVRIAVRQALREAGVAPSMKLVEVGVKAFQGTTPAEVTEVAELDFIM